jgi:hypothetical protein
MKNNRKILIKICIMKLTINFRNIIKFYINLKYGKLIKLMMNKLIYLKI